MGSPDGEGQGIWRSLKGLRERLTRLQSRGLGAGMGSESGSAAAEGSRAKTSLGLNPQQDASIHTNSTTCHHGNTACTTCSTSNTTHTTNLMAEPSHMTLRDTHGHPTESWSTSPTAWAYNKSQTSSKNIVPPSLAKKMSMKAAILGAMIMAPMQSLLTQMAGTVDFMEVACSATSALSTEMEANGYSIQRVNYLEGFDLDKKAGTGKLTTSMKQLKPKMTWVSLPCTRLSSLTHLTPRTPEEQANFEKRQQRDLKRADEVSQAICQTLDDENDFAWEWPTGAAKGWRSRAIKRLEDKMRAIGRPLFWCRLHGCAYGLTFKGIPVKKGWTVMTSNRGLWLALQKKCPGHPEHLECRGHVAQASSYYPTAMVKAAVKAIIGAWTAYEDKANVSLSKDVQVHLLGVDEDESQQSWEGQARQDEPSIMALTRQRYPEERPTGKRLEQIKQTMLRIHRASGHPSMANLQQPATPLLGQWP